MSGRDHVAAASVRRLYGCSARQGLCSLAVLCVFVAGAAWLRRYALIGLFAAVLAPMLLACAVLLLGARVRGIRFGWIAAWSALQLAELRHAVLAAELKALQAQIEPHFLYNTLANTRYLARQDPERAAQMLEHLIAYLHSALPDMRSRDSTLGREFDLAGHYLALMAIRFGPRLQYSLDCPPALAGMPVPPLLLMTLVENAVKHGVERKPGPVRVTLDAQHAGAAVTVTVGDDGAGLDAAVPGSGVGLHNLRQRLAALYGGCAGFSLARTAAGVTKAVLTLPLVETSVEMTA